ncbi:hypothetical protein KBD71_00115 [Candidatus Woesebacteria bacterium]|nr:hypothetical protein [Candidatus Woesebacteria bacterium]
MFGLSDPSLWLWGLLYFISVLIVFIVPGWLLLERLDLRLSAWQNIVVIPVTGMILWGIQGYIFGYAHLRFLTYAYVAVTLLAVLIRHRDIKKGFSFLLRGIRRMDWKLGILLLSGTLIQVMQMIGSGVTDKAGMHFYRVHGQDGIFHLGLISSIVRQFPPIEPGSAHTSVVNYHYWSDLILAEQARIFNIPIHHLFFQFTPILISLLTGLTLIVLLATVSQDQPRSFRKNLVNFGLFFLYFGSDLAYLFMQWLHQTWGFYTSAIDNGATQFLNMPHAMAKLVFLILFLLLVVWRRTKGWKLGLLIAVLGGVLFGIKVYFGLLFAVGFLLVWLTDLVDLIVKIYLKINVQSLVSKKSFLLQAFLIGCVMLVISLFVYLPPNRGSGGLGYYPLEWPKLFMAEENLDWRDWRYKRAIVEYFKNTPKIMMYDGIAIVVTLLCIHGTRLLGFNLGKKTRSLLGRKLLVGFILIPCGLFTFLGLYTLQKSGSFNVFNFFASSLTLLSITAAILLAEWWSSKSYILKGVTIVIILATIPRIAYESFKIVTSYQNQTDDTVISREEIDALSFINRTANKDAIIQSHYANTLDMNTPYTSYFANRFNYMAGQKVLETHAQETQSRYLEVQRLFGSHNPADYREAFARWNISYLYLRNQDALPFDPSLANLTLVYQNTEAKVYQIR